MRRINLHPFTLLLGFILSISLFYCSKSKPEVNISTIGKNSSSITKRSQESVYEIINKNITDLSYCHEKELKRNPTSKGEVSIKITISPAGDVIDLQVTNNSFFSKPLESCLMLFIKRLKFEQVMDEVGNISITYPFIFE